MLNPTKPLDGRTAWVTGGLTGIGLASAKALAKAGANVAVGSLTSTDSLAADNYTTTVDDVVIAQVGNEISGVDVSCYSAALDVTNEESVRAFHAAAIDKLGDIDILVNAAGVGAKSLIGELRDEVWDGALAVNLTGTMRTIRRCFPGMIERRWGRVINIASTAANTGSPGSSAYCASKAGILGLSRCVALEGAPYGVTCNVVNPGYVRTGLSTAGMMRLTPELGDSESLDEMFERAAQTSPQRRLIEADEIADLVVYLSTDSAKGVTMEGITVAGGARW